MLTIRFNRVGKKNKACFRVVLQEHAVAPGGKHIAILGSWNPHQKKGIFNGGKINYWIGKGAQISDSVWNLLIKQGIVKGEKRAVKIKRAQEAEAAPETRETTEAAATPAEEIKKEEKKSEKSEKKIEKAGAEESKKE